MFRTPPRPHQHIHAGDCGGAASLRGRSREEESQSALGAQAPLEACQAAPRPGREGGNTGGRTVHTGNKLLQGKGLIFRTCPALEQCLKGGAIDWNVSVGGASEGLTDVGTESRRDSKVRQQTGSDSILTCVPKGSHRCSPLMGISPQPRASVPLCPVDPIGERTALTAPGSLSRNSLALENHL